jgi:hypothetical protein
MTTSIVRAFESSSRRFARLRSRLNENAAMVGIVHKGMKKSRRLDSAGVGSKR